MRSSRPYDRDYAEINELRRLYNGDKLGYRDKFGWSGLVLDGMAVLVSLGLWWAFIAGAFWAAGLLRH